MLFSALRLTNFRSFSEFELTLDPNSNVILGPNGAGKTSVLEAIVLLLTGKSFRVRQLNRLIRSECTESTAYGELLNSYGQKITLGVQKTQQKSLIHRLNGENIKRKTDVLALLPVQLICHESFQLLDAGPKYRRKFLDWGVFHVEPDFLQHWQQAQKAIEQRNAAIKAQLSKAQVQLWDEPLITATKAIHTLRERYINDLLPLAQAMIQQWLGVFEIEISYYAGWDVQLPYSAVLKQQYAKDWQYKCTQYGPHRADLVIKANGVPADEILSRGQQKLLVCALKLAQGALLREALDKPCLYLLDDLPAELDESRIVALTQTFATLGSQVVITGIDSSRLADLTNNAGLVFHVEPAGAECG